MHVYCVLSLYCACVLCIESVLCVCMESVLCVCMESVRSSGWCTETRRSQASGAKLHELSAERDRLSQIVKQTQSQFNGQVRNGTGSTVKLILSTFCEVCTHFGIGWITF